MKSRFALLIASAGLTLATTAMAQHSKQQIEEDIKRHLAMAQAHQAAAQCLKDGRDYKVCQQELQTACKGLAVGRYCGMRHTH
jgi:hypothetical protein